MVRYQPGMFHYYDIDRSVPRVLGITTRFTLAELSGKWKIGGDYGRVMSHGNGWALKGWLLTGMCFRKEVERRRVRCPMVSWEWALIVPLACTETSPPAALGSNLSVYYSVKPKRLYPRILQHNGGLRKNTSPRTPA